MNSKLNPYYISGLVDGEGCFCVSFNKHKNNRIEVRLIFEIELREDDIEVLERVKLTLGCGNIYHLNYEKYKKWKPHYKYKVSNLKDITKKVIPFFKKYPLQAKKKYSFEVFCKTAELIIAKKHLTLEGVEEIRKLKGISVRDSLDALDTHVQWGAQ
ncbi:LAGLIDADG family homing endonuclease [Candidatus Microgenomates bacterium]|nr:LAGLIDADG family homing endonuclease [Candidatus Microgenomates bacterium]